MAITAFCSECGAAHRFSDEVGGKRVKCKRCGTALRVPDEPDEPDEEQEEDGREGGSESDREEAREPVSLANLLSLPWFYSAIRLISLILFALGLGAFALICLYIHFSYEEIDTKNRTQMAMLLASVLAAAATLMGTILSVALLLLASDIGATLRAILRETQGRGVGGERA